MSSLYLFDSFFSGIVLIDNLLGVDEGDCFPNNMYHGNRKKQFRNFALRVGEGPLKYERLWTGGLGVVSN